MFFLEWKIEKRKTASIFDDSSSISILFGNCCAAGLLMLFCMQQSIASIPDPDIPDAEIDHDPAKTINAYKAYKMGLNGKGISVGVVDTSFDTSSPRFDQSQIRIVKTQFQFDGITYDQNSTPYQQQDPRHRHQASHGTAIVSRIIGNPISGYTGGLAPRANIVFSGTDSATPRIPLPFWEIPGHDLIAPLHQTAFAAYYDAILKQDKNFKIINSSFGGPIRNTQAELDADYLALSQTPSQPLINGHLELQVILA